MVPRASLVKWYAKPGVVYVRFTFPHRVVDTGSPIFRVTNSAGDPPYEVTSSQAVITGPAKNVVTYGLVDDQLTGDDVVEIQIIDADTLIVADEPYTQGGSISPNLPPVPSPELEF